VAFTASTTQSDDGSGHVSASRTLANVGTLVIVNGSAQWLLDFILSRSVYDGATIVVVTIVLARGAMRIVEVLTP
jgi:hypothetical protein